MSEKCGTYAGYVGGCRCDDCKSAAADYARWYRETHPSYRVANAIRVNARRRAALRLANEHPERFAELIEQELAAASSNPSMSIVTTRSTCDKCKGSGRVQNDYGLGAECSRCEGLGVYVVRCGIYDCSLPATHTARLRWPEGSLGERMPFCSAHIRGDNVGAIYALDLDGSADMVADAEEWDREEIAAQIDKWAS